MPQYGIFVYSPAPADPMEISEEYLAALEAYPAQLAELGGTSDIGFAFQPSTKAVSVRGDVVTDGPFLEAKEVIAGYYVLDAPDFETALAIAKFNPATKDGGVEVRQLFEPPAE